MSESEAWIVTKDGKPYRYAGQRFADRNEAFTAVHNWQGQSVDYATTYGGWAIVRVATGTWSDVEADALRRNAQRMFTDHVCEGSRSIDARTNCQACCLNGYQPSRKADRIDGHDVRTDGPNVSNWQRDYVQAGRRIPARWVPLLAAALDGSDGSDNEPWRHALALDVATFGVNGRALPIGSQVFAHVPV